MRFYPYGPFEIPRNGNLVSTDKNDRRAFWDEVERARAQLTDACGCYIFTINGKAWYVGKTVRRFYDECFGAFQLNQYNHAMNTVQGRPRLILLAKLTPNDRLAGSGDGKDIEALENMLIALGVARNPDLCNVKGARYLREMEVPGYLNTPPGVSRAHSVQAFKEALGI